MRRGRGEPPQRDVLEQLLPAREQPGRHVAGGGRPVQLAEPPGAVGVGVVGRQPGLVEQPVVGVVQGGDGAPELGGQPGTGGQRPRSRCSARAGRGRSAARPPSFSAAKPLGVGTLNGSRRASSAEQRRRSTPSGPPPPGCVAPAPPSGGAGCPGRTRRRTWLVRASPGRASTLAGSRPGTAALASAARKRGLRSTRSPYAVRARLGWRRGPPDPKLSRISRSPARRWTVTRSAAATRTCCPACWPTPPTRVLVVRGDKVAVVVDRGRGRSTSRRCAAAALGRRDSAALVLFLGQDG